MSRVCIVTSGGDAPGVNAILRGFVHRARLAGIEVVGSRYGFEGLLAPDGLVPLGLDGVRGVLHTGGSVLGCSTRVSPFAPRDMGPSIVEGLRARGIDVLVLVGGDGSMTAAQRFASLGMPCVGIPKTIDNDLGGTDETVGFDTAVETATRAIDALHSTAEAHRRVMIAEVMGRYAGWIALHAGIAGGADVILIPEIPYDVDRVVAKVKERESLDLRFTIVVVSEGARPVGGAASEIEGAHPGLLPRLGGAGAHLVDALAARDIGHEVRCTVLGHLQRGGSPTSVDRVLGTRLGVAGAKLCEQRAYGRMVCVCGGVIRSVPLDEALGNRRAISRSSELLAAARSVGIELGAAIEDDPPIP
jgi:6-phosphofructokinase 1